MKTITILGSTGSVGRTTVKVVEESRDLYSVESLAAGRRWERLCEQARSLRPRMVALTDVAAGQELRENIPQDTTVYAGPDASERVVREGSAELVVCAVSGAAGLRPSLAALESGKDLALANKETIVMAGPIVMQMAKERGRLPIPVDSEHSAIFQALRGENHDCVRRIILTASGGPFRNSSIRRMAQVTPREALEHPTWAMGAKITIDSATMMNKALEIVEARWLFDIDVSQIEVVVHPQSVVHSIVEFCDGSSMAQMGHPDMSVPVRFALAYPDRQEARAKWLDLPSLGSLTFQTPDPARFPALELGFLTAATGGSMGAVMNAANETAVDAFLDEEIGFLDITGVVREVMEAHDVIAEPSIEEIFTADGWAREEARECIANR